MRKLKFGAMMVGAAMTAMTVTAVIMSAHVQYDLVGQQMRLNANDSTEVLKVHASIHASINVALDQPTVSSDYVITLPPRLSVRS